MVIAKLASRAQKCCGEESNFSVAEKVNCASVKRRKWLV
jgi:hypothetical protein